MSKDRFQYGGVWKWKGWAGAVLRRCYLVYKILQLQREVCAEQGDRIINTCDVAWLSSFCSTTIAVAKVSSTSNLGIGKYMGSAS